MLEEAGDLPAARAAYQRALDVKRSAYGDSHPSVGIALANLAGLLRREGDLAGARQTFLRADRIFALRLPPSDPARQATRAALRKLS